MPFSEKVGDSVISGDFDILNKLIKELKTDYFVDIGILGSGERSESGESVPEYGAKQEYGSDQAGRGPKIPKRSFIKMPLQTKQKEISSDVEKKFQKHIEEGDVKGIFKDIGIAGEKQIQLAFESGGFGTWQQLSEETIQRKKSDAILIDEGTLRKSITSEVSQ